MTAPSDATEVTQIAQEVLQSCPCKLQGLSPGFPWLVGGDIRDPPALLPPTGHPGLGNWWPLQPCSLAHIPCPSLIFSVPWGSEKAPAPERCLGTKNKVLSAPGPHSCPIAAALSPALDVCTQCHPQVTQPRPTVLAPVVVWQRAGPGCAGATCSFYNIWLQISSGELRAGRATPKLPLPLRSAAFARPPTLGNAGLAGEASAPSHRNYRLPWGSGASCNNSLVSRGLRVIMGWTQPSQHPDPGMSPQPVPAPRPWLWVPSGLSVCPFIPGPAELRRRIP